MNDGDSTSLLIGKLKSKGIDVHECNEYVLAFSTDGIRFNISSIGGDGHNAGSSWLTISHDNDNKK